MKLNPEEKRRESMTLTRGMKWMSVGIIVLFVMTRIIPSAAHDMHTLLPAPRESWLYVGGHLRMVI